MPGWIKPVFYTIVMLGVVQSVLAQGTSWPAIVETALAAADEWCAPTGRNQACYGNFALDAEPQSTVTTFEFTQEGDIVDVSNLQTLRSTPMDEESGTWGVALLRLQANLPGTLPGQNVTFLLFGDAEMTNAVEEGSEEYTPMQAFFLRTAIGDSLCEEAPDSGLLVQTPEGVGEVAFNINSVDVSMGSTVYFRAEPEGEMIVSTVEGSAFLQVGDETFPVIAGTGVRVPIGRDLLPNGRPLAPRAYEESDVNPLPMNLLPRRIRINAPLTTDQLLDLQTRIQNNQPLCGDTGLPKCPEEEGRLRDLLLNEAPDVECRTRPGADESIRPACNDASRPDDNGRLDFRPDGTPPSKPDGERPREGSAPNSPPADDATPEAAPPPSKPEGEPRPGGNN